MLLLTIALTTIFLVGSIISFVILILKLKGLDKNGSPVQHTYKAALRKKRGAYKCKDKSSSRNYTMGCHQQRQLTAGNYKVGVHQCPFCKYKLLVEEKGLRSYWKCLKKGAIISSVLTHTHPVKTCKVFVPESHAG